MTVRVTALSPASYKVMPWKNGAGSTTEIYIAPEGASVQSGFDWRISLAQVPASGPFSSFPGYQRTIMLLRGDPMRLVHGGQGEHRLEAFRPYEFHGAWMTEGILTGRPVEDFNVMVRDGFGYAEVHVQRAIEEPTLHLKKKPFHFIVCWEGELNVVVQNQNYQLMAQESLLLENVLTGAVCRPSRNGLAIIVSITVDPRDFVKRQTQAP